MSMTPLTSLSDQELNHLAALHCAVMPTLLAELGLPVVRRYYEYAVADPGSIGFMARSSERQDVEGWVFGSSHPDKLAARLRDSLGWFALQMLRLAFTRPRALLELARSALSPAPENLIQPGEIELTYIGVAPEARGQGLGKGLLEQFLFAAREQGYTRVTLSVETDNQAAVRLYEKAGFVITKTFHEGRFERHRMSLKLTSLAIQEEAK
ncbi:MAG: GNAT family N-acetyltransferase [Chloroflexota bacterium]